MKIQRNISQRTKVVGGKAVDDPDIIIHRNGQSNITVPITARSLHRFMLMQDDYIQLDFSLTTAERFAIGDYITDTFFCRYYITEEQMPRANQQTGGYDYSLRFNAKYMVWRNWIHCLVIDGKRMESRWNLTDTLTSHAQRIADNVNAILDPNVTVITDPTTGDTIINNDGYGIEVTAATAAEIKHISYEGNDIIEAMTMIAEAYGCEWWVTDESVTIGNTIYASTIHFGKCEADIGITGSSVSDGAYIMDLGGNVVSMDIARDQQDYCNRIYAYGGTQNIPETYGRKLEFTATSYIARTRTFKDAARELTLDMIDGESTIPSVEFIADEIEEDEDASNLKRSYSQQIDTPSSLSGKQAFRSDIVTSLTIESDDWSQTDVPAVDLSAKLHYGNSMRDIPVTVRRSGEKGWYAEVSLDTEINLGSTAVWVYVQLLWSIAYVEGTVHWEDTVTVETNGHVTATEDASSGSKPVTIVFGGNEYGAVFYGANGNLIFNVGNVPTGFGVGSKYTIKNINTMKVPLSWYTQEYDAGTLTSLGDRRLHLPLSTYPNRYMEADATRSEMQIVERVVLFDDVFPKLNLRIKSLRSDRKQERIEHSDKTVTYEDYDEYSFKLDYYNEQQQAWVNFNFRIDYLLDGAKLQAVFSAPTSADATGHLLAGMTFDLAFDEYKGFTIIRNNEYGVNLPNDRLKPSDNDTLVLVGWNPNAMTELGMVANAEAELAAKASEYLQAIQEGQFTINAKMFSRTMTQYPFCNGTGFDSNGRRRFGLLDIGCKVKVLHDALPNGYKVSRIIGCEYKLDMPFDTPTYIIGETDAYSRLKQIEKQLTKL